MNKRDFLKTSILSTFGACALNSACTLNQTPNINKPLHIEPKQTDIYKISCPLPFNFKLIEELASLNKKYKKSKIVTLFNNIPAPASNGFNHWISIVKGPNSDINSYSDFFKYARYAKEKGFNICYLLNSPKPFNDNDYKTFKNNFKYLINLLEKENITDIKVGNVQTAQLLKELNPNFNLSISTACEFHNVSIYKNFIHQFPNTKLIDISIDENHNFHFLSNMRKMFPDIKLELMVDEFCIKGCPARISHASEASFCRYLCHLYTKKNYIESSCKTVMIYPWNLSYYSSIGINNFKFVLKERRNNLVRIDSLKNYLDCVEYGIDFYTAKQFVSDFCWKDNVEIPNDLKVSHLIKYLPDIKHFITHGDKCSTECSVTYFYCDKKADEMNKFLSSFGVNA